jgi:peptidoglycan hydrolase FlgJ
MFDKSINCCIQLNSEIRSKSATLDNKDVQKLKESCSEMESLFVYYLLKEMRSTVPKEGLFSGGKAEETFSSVLDFELAKEISSKRGLGISTMLFDQLSNTNSVGAEHKKEGSKEG